MESTWTIPWNPYGLVPWNPYGPVHGIHGGYAYIPYGIHDVHGTMNWLWSQPTLIPWIPHRIADGFHGFHMDSIWINPGKVKTSMGASTSKTRK